MHIRKLRNKWQCIVRIQKTMQRMVESRDLINGTVYGTYKIFTHLPVKEDLVSTENEVIN